MADPGWGAFGIAVTTLQTLYTLVQGYRNYGRHADDILATLEGEIECLKRADRFFADFKDDPTNLESREALDKIARYQTRMSRVHGKCVQIVGRLSTSGSFTVLMGKLTWSMREKNVLQTLAELHTITSELELKQLALPDTVRYGIDLRNSDKKEIQESAVAKMHRRMREVLESPGNDAEVPRIDRNNLEDIKEAPVPGNRWELRWQVKMFKARRVVVEYHSTAPAHEKAVQQLSEVLFAVKPRLMHILQCRAYLLDSDNGWGLVLDLPQELDPDSMMTLRQALETSKSRYKGKLYHSLNQRYQLAKTIAGALYSIYAGKWVHESVRSSNVLLVWENGISRSKRFPQQLGEPFLLGFDYSRKVAESSEPHDLRNYQAQINRIYEHPDRPDVRFKPCHDIFSLGVVLLEIGLFEPIELEDIGQPANDEAEGEHRRKKLLEKSNTLRYYVGRRYEEIVQRCLKTEDEDVDETSYVTSILDHLEDLVEAV